jgi:heme exporter protein D
MLLLLSVCLCVGLVAVWLAWLNKKKKFLNETTQKTKRAKKKKKLNTKTATRNERKMKT